MVMRQFCTSVVVTGIYLHATEYHRTINTCHTNVSVGLVLEFYKMQLWEETR